ncbi:MAG: wax ester/triacylglycerol synthase domain-containing protein [Mycobacterium sp.]
MELLRDSVARRLPAQPVATKRVDTTGPDPRWMAAPDFDIADHIRRVPTPDDGSQADLWRIVSTLMSEHLDRNRPLWTFDVIGPLADGREAIAARIHHAMADGIAGVRFLETVLFDEEHPGLRTDPRPGLRADTAEHRREEEALRMPGVLWRELGHPGSHSPFDQPITAARELAFSVAPLAEMKRIGGSRPDHATVNDVLLAIIAGGLREWLHADGVRARHLRAQVPVSLHQRDGAATAGNHDSFINVDLPLHEPNPLARLDLISRETTKRKHLDDAAEIYDLFHALGRVKRLDRAVQHLAGSAREFSLAISNVPGPTAGVSIHGRRVQNLFSSSEPGAHHCLRISAISCDGDIGIGLCTDPSALPGIPELAAAITRAYTELRDASAG